MRKLLAIVGIVVAAILLLPFVAKNWVVNLYRVPAASMEPSLRCAKPQPGCSAESSDRIAVLRFRYEPRRGDIAVFNTPREAVARCGAGGTFVKRVIAVPGDSFAMDDGVVVLNGKRLREPYAKRDTLTLPERRLGAGQYYVLGDNRPHSCDSRVWGPVPRGNFIGRAFARYWPPGRAGGV